MTEQDHESRLDNAMARRLRRLSAMPVDLASLESRIRLTIPPPVLRNQNRVSGWNSRRLYAIAASLLVGFLIVGVVILTTPRSVVASPQLLEQIYGHSVATNPTTMPSGDDHTLMACCIQQVKGKPVTCVTLDVNGKRVSMAVAEAKHFRVPKDAGVRAVDGVEYRYQSSAKLNMVMAVRGEAWVCLMGEVGIDDLIKQMAKTPVHQLEHLSR